MNYETKFAPPAPFEFVVLNKSLTAQQNSDFVLQVKTQGKVMPENVAIQIGDEEYFLQSTKPGVFEYTFSKLSKDVTLAAQSAATVVILMGMHKLEQILSIYQSHRDDDLPIAIIQNGTKSDQKRVIGTLSSISQLVEQHQLSSPAIIIIGETVRHASLDQHYLESIGVKEISL